VSWIQPQTLIFCSSAFSEAKTIFENAQSKGTCKWTLSLLPSCYDNLTNVTLLNDNWPQKRRCNTAGVFVGHMQGTLTKGEPLVQSTSLCWLYYKTCFWKCKHYLFLYKMNYHNEEVNRTELSPSVSVPWFKGTCGSSLVTPTFWWKQTKRCPFCTQLDYLAFCLSTDWHLTKCLSTSDTR
jgi:hypothetical protein